MSEWVDIPLATGLGREAQEGAHNVYGGSTYVSAAELVNLYLRANPSVTREPFHIASVPALVSVTTPGSGLIRGVCVRENGTIFIIRGTSIYYTSDLSSWTQVPVGTMPGTDLCRMVDADTHVVSVDGTNARAITTAESFACSRANFSDVAYQDGYTIFTETGSNSVYVSNLDDPTTISALDFTTADTLAGDCVGVASVNRQVFVFKTGSIEYFYNAGGSGFPFVRGSPGLVNTGCYFNGALSICEYDGALFWLGDDLRVYMMRGYNPVPISDRWVERLIGIPSSGKVYGSIFVHAGVPFYALAGLQSASVRYAVIYDIKNGCWHVRQSPLSGGLDFLAIRSFTNPFQRTLVAGNGASSGLLYEFSTFSSNDAGASSQTTRTLTLPQYAPTKGIGRTIMYELYLDMEKAATSGTCSLQWSDDSDNYNTAVSGTATLSRVRWQRLGSFYQRIFKFNFAIDNHLAIMGVRARVSAGVA